MVEDNIPMSVKFSLGITVHDPEARIFKKAFPIINQLASLYSQKVANCTKATSKKTVNLLEKEKFKVVYSPVEEEIGTSRRNAIKTLLQTEATKIHYCDFDRLVHWFNFFPNELKKVLKTEMEVSYIALGRKSKAWNTHPKVMIEIERPENNTISSKFSLKNNADFTAGSCLITEEVAKIILKYSIEPTNATDLEWPAIVYRYMNIIPQYILTDGLGFETADYYEDEIKKFGSKEAWIKSVYENPNEIKARTKLANDSISAFNRVLNT